MHSSKRNTGSICLLLHNESLELKSASQKNKQELGSELYYVQQSTYCFRDLVGCLCFVCLKYFNLIGSDTDGSTDRQKPQ